MKTFSHNNRKVCSLFSRSNTIAYASHPGLRVCRSSRPHSRPALYSGIRNAFASAQHSERESLVVPKSFSTRADKRKIKGVASPPGRSSMTFFLLVFALAIPFLVIGAMTGIQLLPGLPVAALIAVCPAAAALILAHREDGSAGAKALLKRAFDYQRIRKKIWYAPILLLMPGVMVLSFGVMRWTGTPVPAPQIAVVPALILCVAFFTSASAEELGWSGYVIDPMQN